ncbi:hypothetical protein [Simkania sp.]|uniref:hypothetical protein n=1 Tax=Simkania sp. TaxID=34094 RepID=UPI003B51ECCF
MNASSQVETQLSNIMLDVNTCENGNGTTDDVDDAVKNMNDILVEMYTDPALSNEDTIKQTQNSGEDLLGGPPKDTDNYTVQKQECDVYYDGSATATEVMVPQITSYNSQAILDQWDGSEYAVGNGESPPPAGGSSNPNINPTDQGYQLYVSKQQQWSNDLTTVDDSCGEVDQMAQAEFSQAQSNQKSLLGTLKDALSDFVKNQSYWNQKAGN